MVSGNRTSLTLPAEPASLGKVLELVNACAARAGLSVKQTTQLELAVEEVLVNILKHAYSGGPGQVVVNCRVTVDGAVELELRDQGPAFDPLSLAAPDTTSPVEERPVGGLGVHLAKQLTDRIEYRRDGNSNVLILSKKAHP